MTARDYEAEWIDTMGRMKRSTKTLELAAWEARNNPAEQARLNAKVSGVKLALSYMEELGRGE